jgi:hypothetical protein
MPGHAALVTAVIVDHLTCLDCLAEESSLSVVDVTQTLTRIESAVAVHRSPGHCRACGRPAIVLTFDRPKGF